MQWADVKRARWEDHAQYLAGLSKALERSSAERLIVVGDFNQSIGQGSSTPLNLRAELQEAYPSGMTIATSAIGFHGRRSIDHIALSEDMAAESLSVISNIHNGKELSDHFGVAATLSDRDLC